MFDHMPVDQFAKISHDGRQYEWNNWADIMEPSKVAEVWAFYSNQFYAGKAAVVHCKLGNGTVTYIGCDTDDGDLEKDMLKKVYKNAGLSYNELPEGVIQHWRNGFWVAINYSSSVAKLELPGTTQIIFGSPELKPAEVVVWK